MQTTVGFQAPSESPSEMISIVGAALMARAGLEIEVIDWEVSAVVMSEVELLNWAPAEGASAKPKAFMVVR